MIKIHILKEFSAYSMFFKLSNFITGQIYCKISPNCQPCRDVLTLYSTVSQQGTTVKSQVNWRFAVSEQSIEA